MRWVSLALLGVLCTPACSLPRVVHDLHEEAPPAELGRPAWVRGAAQVGAWIGAIGGAVASVVTLPITYPISLMSEEPLGYSREEFLFAPVTFGASFGHFLFGAPTDTVHLLFYRAWVDEPRPTTYEFTPMAPPAERAGSDTEPVEMPPAEGEPAAGTSPRGGA